jgi:hypothetical protein
MTPRLLQLSEISLLRSAFCRGRKRGDPRANERLNFKMKRMDTTAPTCLNGSSRSLGGNAMPGWVIAGFLFLTLSAARSQPVDDSYFLPPAYVGEPKPEHAATNRAFQGIPSLVIAPGGRLWVAWYAGVTPGEDQNNHVVVATSGDHGKSWKEVLVIDPDGSGPVRAYDPELWIAPDGKLRVFWAQGAGKNCKLAGVWSLEASDAAAEHPAWGAPRRLSDGVMMCKPTVLSTGEWVLPASTWYLKNSARMVVSNDQGKTWSVRGSCNVPKKDQTCDEHVIVERTDGSLWMLIRTRYGIGESISSDRGMTWSECAPSGIDHPSSRFFITRLKSGNLLLVKHVPVDQKIKRTHLTAYISKDDGKNWEGGLLLDDRAVISYPDGQQADDGTIFITYDYNRTGDREIYFASFREEDVLAGKAKSADVRLRQLVNKGSGGRMKVAAPLAQGQGNDGEGEALSQGPFGQWLASGGSEVSALSEGAQIFTDREHVVAVVPGELQGAKFLRLSISEDKTVKCNQTGTVFFLTPMPSRNRDSQSKVLESQGFSRVDLAEFPLFGMRSKSNQVTVYQKDCAAGEEFSFKTWAVPFFFEQKSD